MKRTNASFYSPFPEIFFTERSCLVPYTYFDAEIVQIVTICVRPKSLPDPERVLHSEKGCTKGRAKRGKALGQMPKGL